MKLHMLCALLLAACGSHETRPSAVELQPAKHEIAPAPAAKPLEFTAVVTSRTSRVITAASDGAVMSLQHHNDEYVHLGDAIAQIDVSELRAKEAELEGQLKNAQGAAARAGAMYAAAARKARAEQRLARLGASSRGAVDTALSEVSAAGAEGAGAGGSIEAVKMQIAEQKRLIDAANIKSPMDGTIAVVKVHLGDAVRKGAPIARVFDPTDPIVKFALPRAKRDLVKPGDTVQMTVGDHNEHTINVVIATITDDHDPAIDYLIATAELEKTTTRPADIRVGVPGHVHIADKGAVR
jgi:multidrug efflux pump subunit AcrA (membrane-fusion protein)